MRDLPGGLILELRLRDAPVLVLRSISIQSRWTASEAVAKGENRVGVGLACLKGLVGALVDGVADLAEVLRSAASEAVADVTEVLRSMPIQSRWTASEAVAAGGGYHA